MSFSGEVIKRVFDVLISLMGLVLFSPLFLVLAISIKRDSPGPVFYGGLRAARNGGTFKIIKFRTMYHRPEAFQGPIITAQKDPRITPLGRWLRATKLNELPQLLNVLRGDMSLVGPRPEDPDIVANWSREVQDEILSVRPGITSPASVLYRDEEELLNVGQVMNVYLNEILPSKLRLDQLYVRNRSFWLDFDVLFWTFLVLLPQLESYKPPEERLFWGPVSRLIRRYVSWFFIDLVITFGAFAIAGALWRSAGPLNVGWLRSISVAFGFSLLFSVTGAVLGANRIEWSHALASDVFDLLPAVALAAVVVLLINHWTVLFPPSMVLVASGLSFAGFVVIRYRTRLLTGLASRLANWRQAGFGAWERVLILGGGEAGQFAAWILGRKSKARAFQVVGFVDDDLHKQGARIRGLNVLGKRHDIARIVTENDVGIIVFAIHNISTAEKETLLAICAQTTARVIMLPDFIGQLTRLSNLNSGFQGKPERSSEASYMQPELVRLESCFDELAELAQRGDLDAVQDRIEYYRAMLCSLDSHK